MARKDRDQDIQQEHWDFIVPFFRPKIFSLEEANIILPDVIRITEQTLAELDSINGPFRELGLRKWNVVAEAAEEDTIKANWVHQIARMGILPKGFFTVDFASPEEGVFYCWAYGEDRVGHQHKAWEGFADRVPVTEQHSVN